MYNNYGMMGYGWGLIMMLGAMIISVLIIVVLVRYLQNTGRPNYREGGKSALDILDEKYAKGEITEEEYKNKKAHIKQ
jgi:putative membrane protein